MRNVVQRQDKANGSAGRHEERLGLLQLELASRASIIKLDLVNQASEVRTELVHQLKQPRQRLAYSLGRGVVCRYASR